jgi:hypothetical protein
VISKYPVVLLRTGTFNGSNGPVYYSAARLAKSVPTWEGRSTTVGHPVAGGRFVSVHFDADTFARFHCGTLEAVNFDGAALTATAAVERGLLGKLNPLLLMQLDHGQFKSVSTGLWFDADGNIHGDHVALLGWLPGACDVGHGCGVGGVPLVGNAAARPLASGVGLLPSPSAGYSVDLGVLT